VPDPRSYTPDHLAEKIRARRGALEGERKQVTVLFADVMGSMELAEGMDPEQWRRIMDRFFGLLCAGVHRFEGTVDKFTGDGIMALFGAPIAHEDHARRACYAALHLQREIATYAAELRRTEGLNFSVRMGINSGEVVVGAIGDDLSMAYTAMGHTVGLAQRMEQLAEPGRIYLTQHAASLVEGFLALRALGEFQVRGVGHALHVHELTGMGAVRGSLDRSRARGFSRFVGRDEELRSLERALAQALDGHGQVIGIIGEAGVGKSRLCHEFTERQRAKGVLVYHVAGQAHASKVPLLPLLQVLRSYFDINERDAPRAARERIAGKLLLLDESFTNDLPLLFDFLAVPDPDRPVPRMDPEARQRQLLRLTKRLIHAQSVRETVINVFEDLHWIDPATEVFLANHVEAVQGTRNLTLVNFRPEYRAPWMSMSYYRQIALSPLVPEAVEAMLAGLLGPDPSLAALPPVIQRRTQGNPFFIEELVTALVEAGSLEGGHGTYRLVRPIDEVTVPPNVQAVLSARIDRLAAQDKAVLQGAAVIGKEFSEPVLRQVVGLDAPHLEASLRTLTAGEFIYEQELYPEAIHTFKHPLTREVAYGSQLGERRAAVHKRVAAALMAQYPDRLDERAALLAQHWEAAGETLEAARWHARAAGWSGTNDPTQAMRHWTTVRELADTLPQSAETMQLGLAARISLLNYGWRLGMFREEAETLFHEADLIASEVGDVRSRALMVGLYANVRGLTDGDLHEYAQYARQARSLAAECDDPGVYVALALTVYASVLVGEWGEALDVLDRAIQLAEGNPAIGSDIIVRCPYAFHLSFKGTLLVYQGRFEEGRRVLEQGLTLAREHADVEVTVWSYGCLLWLAYLDDEPEAMVGCAQQAVEIAERLGDSFSRSAAWFWLGWAEQVRGSWRSAIDAILRSQAISRERGTAVEFEPHRLAVLGEAYMGDGDPERALGLAREGVEVADTRGNALVAPYAYLALARILRRSATADARMQSEAALARALELSRRIGAKAFEPLIHVELAERARQLGDGEERQRELREAHRLSTEIGAIGRAARLASEIQQGSD
jgi:class 3 adenylate cyclase/tetratricopeptide (TPR) repeat protein